MEEASTRCKIGGSAMTIKRLAILDKERLMLDGSSVIPAQAPNPQERDGPASQTNLAPLLRAKSSRHCAPRTPLPPKSIVPKVHHLPAESRVFLHDEEEELHVPAAGRRAHSHDIPKIQKRPHPIPAGPFPNSLQTLRVYFANFHRARGKGKDSKDM